MVWVACFVSLVIGIFFLVKREFTYFVIVFALLIVSIPLYFYFDFVERKSKNVILYLDYSESSVNKVKNIEEKINKLDFDLIRYFGKPFNRESDFDVLSQDNINIIVSDFLFDIPAKLTNGKNNIFISLGDDVRTNHLVRKVYITNISQIDYLSIDMIQPSTITIKDEKGKTFFKGENKKLYLVPLNLLPSKISLVSLNTNITVSLERKKKLGVVWFEPNQDLTKLLRVLRNMNYDYDLFVKFSKNFSYKSYSYMIFGYPDVSFEEVLKTTYTNSRCVVISPSESFLAKFISFSKIKNVKLSKNDFYYLEDLGIFDFYFEYPVNIAEVYKFSFPKLSSKVVLLDRIGISFYIEVFGRKFLFFNVRNIYKVDSENYKVGVYSTFSEDLYTEFLRFLFRGEKENSFRELNLEESAFEGARTFDGAIPIEKLNNELINKLRNAYLEEGIITKKVDPSSFWWLMVLIIVGLSVKWFLRG